MYLNRIILIHGEYEIESNWTGITDLRMSSSAHTHTHTRQSSQNDEVEKPKSEKKKYVYGKS